jgi:sugar phosphate isomerase/epimerase
MIAAQLYTLRDRLQVSAQVAGVLHRLRDLGYSAVEVAGLSPAVAEHFDAELRSAGLTACAAHVGLDALRSDLAAEAARCREWGCEYIVIPSVPAEYHSPAGFERFAREASDLTVALRDFGLRLAYHNHAFELERWDGRSGLEILFDATPPELLAAELDTYWLQFAGASPVAWIRRLAGRVPLVHLKDMSIAGGAQVQREVGEGNLDWPGILDACRDTNTRWLVVEQDEANGDPLHSLAISYRNLTELLA